MNDELIETTDSIENIEVFAEIEKQCIPGIACKEGDFFEMITTCELCGKLF